ncbi:right-handed parallel beta-helix repeat-containing protein [Actinoplanes sp. TFC3]|uniref:right-handed parallel beta-helix repeat-containing protein n=1 Tax=Actinoplanes sp. TFC3 TaxID=1710355 RepID=UPI0008343F69|nr:right-handed parallel beta-helix repeat-containing protein [Actinoplanes sp. TFC3]
MRLHHVAAVAVALPAALGLLAAPASASAASPLLDAAPYSLASSVSPAPMTAAECAAEATCVAAPAPKGGEADDYAALTQAITAAATRTQPTATVLLQPGTYRLSNSLKLPANVSVRGAGMTATSLVMDSPKNFGYGFLIRPADAKEAGSQNLVSDLTVNGNCRTDAGSPVASSLPGRPGQDCDFQASANTGGGIKAGDRWTVRQVRFTNLGYFKMWVSQTVGVRVLDNRFDNWGGAESGDEDNIGGGRNDDTVIEGNQFDATIRGNSFDFVNAVRTIVRNNVVHTNPDVAAARGVNEYGNMYFEGVQSSTAIGNTLEGAHIVLSSNANYPHMAPNKDITNPRGMLVAENRILDSYTTGVAVSYNDYTDSDGTGGTSGTLADESTSTTDHIVRAGGANTIRDNVIERSRQSGIIVYGNSTVKTAPDTITGNQVVNAGFGGATEYNTGAGRVDTSGIAITVGIGDTVQGNTVVDNQANPTTWYGIYQGAKAVPGATLNANSVSGIVATPVRTAALAPEAPTGLATTSSALTWSESYATSTNPIAGYRVFRNGVQLADLPVGSATVPGNLVGSDDSWTPGFTARLSRTGSTLALTATAAGQMNVTGKKSPVTAGATYTSVASFQAATAARKVRAGLAFTDAAGKVSRLATSNKATVDGIAGWVTSSYSVVAPAGAVSVQPFLMVEDAVAGETHSLTRLGLVTGTATEQFSSSSSALVAGSYQVVAYRAGSGDFSSVASVTLP